MSSFIRSASLLSGASLVLAPLALLAQPALATATCPVTVPASTLVAPGICEVTFTEGGDYTFDVPAGIEKVSAVLVGAGSGSTFNNYNAYGGGGGDVVYVDDVPLSATLNIHVGFGGAAGDGQDSQMGEQTLLDQLSANGGYGAGFGGPGWSGNENVGYDNGQYGSGGGADGVATGLAIPGVGVRASGIAQSDAFPPVSGELVYGAGGAGYNVTDGDPGATPQIPGNGGNSRSDSSGDDGVDGAVILHLPLVNGAASESTAKSLASTGSNGFGAGFGIASVVAGLALIATSRRRRTN
ncbi:MAG: hypothetical protein RL556_677 [Actinomycetota bacterium]|jgi:hypothetical protein